MSNSSDNFNSGDLVLLSNNAVNRFLSKNINLNLIGKVYTVKHIEFEDGSIEKCVTIDRYVVFMKHFPLWNKAKQ